MGAPKGVPQPRREDWPVIRQAYETSAAGLRVIARQFGVPKTTMENRMRREGWAKLSTLARKVSNEVKAKREAAAIAVAEREIGPWIEARKAAFIKECVTASHDGVKRVRKFHRANKDVEDSKEEADIGRALESYTRAGRVSLGLTDGSAAAGNVNFQILCNQAAIVQAPSKSENPPA